MVDNVEHVGAANVDDMLYPCQKCQRRFRTLRRSTQHTRHCRIQQHLVPEMNHLIFEKLPSYQQ